VNVDPIFCIQAVKIVCLGELQVDNMLTAVLHKCLVSYYLDQGEGYAIRSNLISSKHTLQLTRLDDQLFTHRLQAILGDLLAFLIQSPSDLSFWEQSRRHLDMQCVIKMG